MKANLFMSIIAAMLINLTFAGTCMAQWPECVLVCKNNNSKCVRIGQVTNGWSLCGSCTCGSHGHAKVDDKNVITEISASVIYSNPGSNTITVKVPHVQEGELLVADLFGQTVYKAKLNSEEEKIDVGIYPVGMYIARWSNGENTEMRIISVTE
jgi:hypothetical protein